MTTPSRANLSGPSLAADWRATEARQVLLAWQVAQVLLAWPQPSSAIVQAIPRPHGDDSVRACLAQMRALGLAQRDGVERTSRWFLTSRGDRFARRPCQDTPARRASWTRADILEQAVVEIVYAEAFISTEEVAERVRIDPYCIKRLLNDLRRRGILFASYSNGVYVWRRPGLELPPGDNPRRKPTLAEV